MGLEIERKFLVMDLYALSVHTIKERIRQGYLNLDIDRTVRVRIVNDSCGWLTIKGRNEGAIRAEYEYRIPEEDCIDMLEMCVGGYIDKTRHLISTNHVRIEVDVFEGLNTGLVVAEIEFDETDPLIDLSEGELASYLPSWIGKEVTDDVRYYNSALITNPYTEWK